LRGQEKVTKKKAARKLVGIFNPNPLASKVKQALRELGRCCALFALKQTLAMILFYFRCSAAFMWGDDDIGSISKIRKKEKLKTKTNS